MLSFVPANVILSYIQKLIPRAPKHYRDLTIYRANKEAFINRNSIKFFPYT